MTSEGCRWKVGSRSDLWTPALDQTIFKHWPNYKAIHDLIGRTRQAIYKRGNELGLRSRQPLQWPDEIAKCAVEGWIKGLSASQIASLVGKTRSAVIGKLHRLGFIGSRDEKVTTERRRQTEARRRQTQKSKNGASSSPRKRRPARERTALPPAAPVPPLLIPLIFTKQDQCRFIPENDGLCCGHPVVRGESWCGFHYNQVFRQDDR